MERIPASERTREKLRTLIEGRSEAADERSELVRLAARLIIEEALEGEARDAVGRDYYARGATPGAGYRNGYRPGRLKSAEGSIEYSAPQIADRREPFRSRIRETVRDRTEELEALAVEMYARGLSTRDIEAVFADADGRSLLSRTAVSEITERLWAEYEAFASRDLSEFAVTYLFVDGIAERLHLGQPREAVLAAWGILSDGKKALLHLAPGTKEDTAKCREFFQELRRRDLPGVFPVAAPALSAGLAAGGQRRSTRHDPRHRGMSAALDSPALPGAQEEKSTKQDARRRLAGVQGARRGLLPGGLASIGAPAARRHRDDLRQGPALGGGVSQRRLRGVHCASALPARPSPGDPHHQSARAIVWRGPPTHQGDPACLWRARCLEAGLRRAHSRRRTMARHPHYRV